MQVLKLIEWTAYLVLAFSAAVFITFTGGLVYCSSRAIINYWRKRYGH